MEIDWQFHGCPWLYICPVLIPKVANSYSKAGELTEVAKEQTIDQSNHADNFILSPLIWIRYQLWVVAELALASTCKTLVRFPEKQNSQSKCFSCITRHQIYKIYHPAACILLGYYLNYSVLHFLIFSSILQNNYILFFILTSNKTKETITM